MVKLETSLGDITLELDEKNAPITTANFLQYVKSGFYDGTIFHRVIKGFMVQGGGMKSGLIEKPTNEPIKNEADNGLANLTGTIAMARTMVADSATAQFFINCNDNDFLNHTAKTQQGWGYAVFGKVTEGMDIVRKIEAEATGNQGHHADVPEQEVTINKATIF